MKKIILLIGICILLIGCSEPLDKLDSDPIIIACQEMCLQSNMSIEFVDCVWGTDCKCLCVKYIT